MASFSKFDQRGWLRIMDERHIGIEREFPGTLPVHLKMIVPHLLGNTFGVPLKGIVNLLRDIEKIRVSFNDFPSDIDAQFVEDRNHSLENLSNPASGSGRVDMEEGAAFHLLAKLLDEHEISFGHDP
jgi:hypothetical protein